MGRRHETVLERQVLQLERLKEGILENHRATPTEDENPIIPQNADAFERQKRHEATSMRRGKDLSAGAQEIERQDHARRLEARPARALFGRAPWSWFIGWNQTDRRAFLRPTRCIMTDDTVWNRPVIIAIGSARYIIKNSREAAWLLADKWPVLTGKPFVRALRACAAVLEGKHSATHARLALIDAARHARLQIEG
jgi:hypothetical protein